VGRDQGRRRGGRGRGILTAPPARLGQVDDLPVGIAKARSVTRSQQAPHGCAAASRPQRTGGRTCRCPGSRWSSRCRCDRGQNGKLACGQRSQRSILHVTSGWGGYTLGGSASHESQLGPAGALPALGMQLAYTTTDGAVAAAGHCVTTTALERLTPASRSGAGSGPPPPRNTARLDTEQVWPHARNVLAGTRGIGDQMARFAALANHRPATATTGNSHAPAARTTNIIYPSRRIYTVRVTDPAGPLCPPHGSLAGTNC
jgi:hypothetical protein